MMDHPNIAQIFDAGATAKGRPYFVMSRPAVLFREGLLLAAARYAEGASVSWPFPVPRGHEGASLHWPRTRDPALQDCHPRPSDNSRIISYLRSLCTCNSAGEPMPQPDSTHSTNCYREW
jgi:hypothetical protein